MKKWLKRLIIIAVIAAAALAAYFIYAGITDKAQQEQAFSSMPSTGETTTGDISLTVSGSGNLSSAQALGFETPGYIVIGEMLAEEGDTISSGQTIATLDTEAMQDYLDELEQQITETQISIDTLGNVTTSLSIKSPADGWVKNVMLDDDDMIEDAMEEYGYVALIATEKREIINAQDSSLSEGDTVKVKCEKHWYTGEVVDEDGTLYVSIGTVYRTVGAEALVCDTDKNELFTGYIELASYIPVESSFGTISDVKFSEDDDIEAGETIYRASQYSVEATALYEQLDELKEEYELVSSLVTQGEITAESDGVVTSVSAMDGQVCEADTELLTIASTDAWQAVIDVDELDINSIEIGQEVEVSIDSMPDDTFTGYVTGISDYGSASGGITTYNVKVQIDDNDSFKLAMTLNCEIKTQEASNVILAPVDAVRTSGNKSYVMVEVERSDEQIDTIKQLILDSDYTALADYLGEDAAELGINVLSDWSELLYGEIRAVETGLQNAFYVEIKSGLSEGESVLLTESDSSSSSDMFMMGAMQEISGGFQPGSAGGDRPSGGAPSGMGGN